MSNNVSNDYLSEVIELRSQVKAMLNAPLRKLVRKLLEDRYPNATPHQLFMYETEQKRLD